MLILVFVTFATFVMKGTVYIPSKHWFDLIYSGIYRPAAASIQVVQGRKGANNVVCLYHINIPVQHMQDILGQTETC